MRTSAFSFLSLLLALLMLLEPISVMASAAQSDNISGWPAAPAIHAEAAVLMDARTGNLLYEKNKDDKHYPASITKIMTTLLALENCDNYQEMVPVSAQALHITDADSSTIWAVEGEELKMSQCLYAVMLASANEMANAVGEYTSGNLKRFVEDMNARARELGCQNTHFNNANGLPDERHYTTAYDMALISRAAWQNRWFRKIAGTTAYTIPPTNKTATRRELANHHRMVLQSYPCSGCVGGKTGYTTQAGNTLVTYVRRGSVTLIAVVMQSDSSVYDDTNALIEYGFGNFHRISIPAPGSKTLKDYFLPNVSWRFPSLLQTPLTVSYEDGYAVLPKGAEEKDLTARQTYLPNALGKWKIRTDYFYNDCKVGVSYSYLQRPLQELDFI
ncbi:MAG TPA: D-alanyl-D-alanine carboxypeptidase [Candidatus Blautia gallistercoris]|uniref:D-alanyl-D-alanine carboxypeptidase n=1 Tax=Candidatus Blautia gallistercoris TaxID=2838490 RepID=A0A9D2B234_9FIRM|nr:D-alanyl-D-alanine carboxypeptidase [Candidatus Blautia gallistercoris]